MNLKAHLVRQMAFGHATWGPGARTAGVVDHIRKELKEIEASSGSADEWVDVVILALDGLTRQLAFCNGGRADPEKVAEIACNMIRGKQTRNEARTWPDWRGVDPNKAIEHARTPEEKAAKVLEAAGGFCAGAVVRNDALHAKLTREQRSKRAAKRRKMSA